MPPLDSCRPRPIGVVSASRRIALAIMALLVVTVLPVAALPLLAFQLAPLPMAQAAAATSASATAPEPDGAGVNPFSEPVGGEALTRGGVLSPEAIEDPVPDVPAEAFLVADIDTGEVLTAKNVKDNLDPATSLQLLAALTLAPRLDPQARYTLTEADTDVSGTSAGLHAGTTYSIEDLFHGMFLRSGTDATSALVNAAGGADTITTAMTAEAIRLGAFDTAIIGPTASHGSGQHTTAYDLSLIARAAFEDETVARYAGAQTHELPADGNPSTGGNSNENPGAGSDGGEEATAPGTVRIEDRSGLLTGYSDTVGVFASEGPATQNTLVAAAERNERRLLVTVMHAEAPSWQQASALLDWGFETPEDFAPVGDLVTPDEVAAAMADTAPGDDGPGNGSDTGADDPETEAGPTTGDDAVGDRTDAPSSSSLFAWLEGLDYTLLMLLGLAAMFVVMAGARVRSVLIARRNGGDSAE